MAPFPIAAAAFAMVAVLLAFALRRFRRAAAWVTGVVAVLFPFASDTSDWNTWFDWAKRYSVVIPVFLWALIHHRPDHIVSRWAAQAMPAVIILNVLEAAALDLFGPSPFNGLLLLVVAICVPWRFTWDEGSRQLGFRDVLWQLAFLLTLTRLYVMNPQFENTVTGAVLVISLASLACLLERDSQGFIGWRAYTLYVLVLQDSILPAVSEFLYPAWAHPDNRLRLHGTLVGHVWLAANAVVVTLLVAQRIGQGRSQRRINVGSGRAETDGSRRDDAHA